MPTLRQQIGNILSGKNGASIGATLFGGAGVLMAIRVASMLIAFGLHLMIARLLGATGYGHYSYAAAWVAFLQVISACGMADASIRFISAYRADQKWGLLRGFLRDSTTLMVGASSVVGTSFAIGVWALSDRIDAGTTSALYMAALATLPVTLAGVWTTKLRGLKRVAESAIPVDIFHPIVFALFLLAHRAWVNENQTGADAMLAHAAGILAAFLLGAYFFQRALPKEVSESTPERDRGEWIGVSMPLMAMSLLVIARARSSTLIVGFYESPEAVGYFASANRVAALTSFGAMAIAMWAAPFISELHTKGDKEGLQRLLILATRGGAALMIPVGLILIVFGEEILGLFGEEFRAGHIALVILTLGQVLNALTGPVGFLMTMTGHQRAATGIEMLSTALQIVATIALLPNYGIAGAAFAAALAGGFRNLVMFAVAWRQTGIRSSLF